MADLEKRDLTPRLPARREGGDLPATRRPVVGPEFEPPQDEGGSLRHYLEILARRKWMALAVAVTWVVAVGINIATTTPVYQASVILEFPTETRLVPYEDIGEPAQRFRGPSDTYIATQIEKLRSRQLALRVAERLDLAADPAYLQPVRQGLFVELFGSLRRPIEGLWRASAPRLEGGAVETEGPPQIGVGRIQANVSASRVRNTNLLRVSFTSPDPGLAARVANALGEELVESTLAARYESIARATRFLEQELGELEGSFEESERALHDFARERDILDVGSPGDTAEARRLADLLEARSQLESEIAIKRARWESVSSGGGGFPDSLRDSAIRATEGRLAELERQLAALSVQFGPEWPSVRAIREEIEQLRKQLSDERRRSVEGLRQEYLMARRSHERLEAEVQSQREAVARLNQDSVLHTRLQRAAATDRELYAALLHRLKEAGVAAGLSTSDVRLAEAAETSGNVHSPNKSQALLHALLLGLGLGIGLAFAVESLDSTLKTCEDITRHLSLPTLGMVPSLAPPGPRRLRHWLRREEGTTTPIIAFSDSNPVRDRSWEAYRSLRTSILLSHSGRPPRSLLFTSTLAGEGKSTTAVNVAIALAQTGGRTVLVDLDLRRPALGPLFGLDGHQGMSSFLSGNSDLSSQIWETTFPNLFVVPSGSPAPNPVELLGSERMEAGLQLLEESFTFVVIDTPPSLELSDALALSPWVDGVIFVTRAGRAPREVFRRTTDRFLEVGAKVLGVLVNDVDMRQSGYGYGYGYYGHDAYYASVPRRQPPRRATVVRKHGGMPPGDHGPSA